MASIETRPCGSSGLQLPVVGLGCWAFGGGEYWGAQSQDDVDDVVHAALDLGINYFDSAEASRTAFATPEGKAAFDDAENFLNLDRVRASLCEEITIL